MVRPRWPHVLLGVALSACSSAQTGVSNAGVHESQTVCKTDRPVYVDRHGKPVWFDTESLTRRVRHCVAPEMPSLYRQAEIEGYVLVDILVNDKGKVWCARIVSGHPLLTTSAIHAVKNWTFRLERQSGKPVWFYGHLRFHFTNHTNNPENPCTVAHW